MREQTGVGTIKRRKADESGPEGQRAKPFPLRHEMLKVMDCSLFVLGAEGLWYPPHVKFDSFTGISHFNGVFKLVLL